MNPFDQPLLLGVLQSLSHSDGIKTKCGLFQIGETASGFTALNRDPGFCTLTEATLSLFPCSNGHVSKYQTGVGRAAGSKLRPRPLKALYSPSNAV